MFSSHLIVPNGTAKSKSTAPEYGAWQSSIYLAGAMHGIKPTVTTDPNKLEAEAKRAMSAVSYNYVAGGAGERATMIANRLAFRQWKIIPRMLRSSADRDLTVRIFGETYSSPVFCAPVGVQSVYHADGEIGVAEAAAEIDVPFVCSTASTASIEEVAIANDKGAEQRAGPGTRGRRWYQLYWPQTEAITESVSNDEFSEPAVKTETFPDAMIVISCLRAPKRRTTTFSLSRWILGRWLGGRGI